MFSKLHIAEDTFYRNYLNQYAVIHLSLNDIAVTCTSYAQYIDRIQERLVRDLKNPNTPEESLR